MNFETAFERIEKKPVLEEIEGTTTIKISNTVAKNLKSRGKQYDTAIRELISFEQGEIHKVLLAMATELKIQKETIRELNNRLISFLEYVQSKTG